MLGYRYIKLFCANSTYFQSPLHGRFCLTIIRQLALLSRLSPLKGGFSILTATSLTATSTRLRLKAKMLSVTLKP